ncbi:uncharacterized protein LOC109503905 isoform X2 [Harpegnathos saltator]|uniref:uncharacterized protein LOC109503905 isoform X2 n=1 Tax=Harpegnathos saltator TaxID=610380 RepID=UPI0009491284|nr:uncharacterized protein LOC109503905 isoform X2 [Harpegnathos saltator]
MRNFTGTWQLSDSRGPSIEPCGCLNLGPRSVGNEDDRQRSGATESNWVVTLKFEARFCHARLSDLKAGRGRSCHHHHHYRRQHRYHHRRRHHQRHRHHYRSYRQRQQIALVKLAREIKSV